MVLDAYLTVWIISYINPYNYVISLELKSFLSNEFYCKTLGEEILLNWYWKKFFKNQSNSSN